jgi:predicted lipid-binding transport protein (Tim44 family)
MPRTTPSSSQASSSRAQSSHPTIEQRDILFETEFDINGDFKNFEATQWVVQEFKRQGLKKLFKLVTSTAYTRLVVQFYSNLSRDCNKPGTLSSTVQGKQVDVTTSDIAAALHCNDEHLPANA